jgi:exodeoxyribonuclease-3
MKIACWNVNGIRSVYNKGFKEWIHQNSWDIICIQENKAQKGSLNESQYVIPGYNCYWAEALKKGYSGVSIWVKQNLNVHSFQIGIGNQSFDSEGRTIILELDDFYLINGYFPNGREDHSRVDFKLEYSYEILSISKKLRLNKPVIICGDVNTAHNEIDLARPETNANTTGFLLNERKFIDDLEKNEFYDIFRLKYPNKIIYSWWSYRTMARQRNVGWRIDYFIVDKHLISKIKEISYLTDQLGSDHCPLILEL